MIKKYKLLSIVCFSLIFVANAATIDDEIDKLRSEFTKQQEQEKTIKELDEHKKVRAAYIADFKARKECETLGIDCDTGKYSGLTIKDEIAKINAEKQLIDARLSLAKKKKNCEKQGINCTTGDEVVSSELPQKPQLVGFFNNYALFIAEDGRVKKYTYDDRLINNYVINDIMVGSLVKLQHKDADTLIIIKVE